MKCICDRGKYVYAAIVVGGAVAFFDMFYHPFYEGTM